MCPLPCVHVNMSPIPVPFACCVLYTCVLLGMNLSCLGTTRPRRDTRDTRASTVHTSQPQLPKTSKLSNFPFIYFNLCQDGYPDSVCPPRKRLRVACAHEIARDRHEIATRSDSHQLACAPRSPDLKRYSPQISPRAFRARPASGQRGSSSAVLRCRRPGQCLPLSLRPPPPHLPCPLARLPLDEGQCRLQGRLLVGSATPGPAPRRTIEGRARLHRVEHRGAEHEAHLLRGRLGMA